MKTLIVAAAVAIVSLSTVGCAVTSGQSSVGEYVDDTTVATRVKARLAEDPEVSAVRIQVEVLQGVVQLAGFAKSQSEKDRAGVIARGVPNVKSVANNIVVRSGN